MRWESHCGASEASGAPLDDNAGPGMYWESDCGASEASGAPLDDNAGTKKSRDFHFSHSEISKNNLFLQLGLFRNPVQILNSPTRLFKIGWDGWPNGQLMAEGPEGICLFCTMGPFTNMIFKHFLWI